MVLFFLTKQGHFANTLAELRRKQAHLPVDDLDAMHSISDMYECIHPSALSTRVVALSAIVFPHSPRSLFLFR